jgi:hypothetical protein
LAPPLGSTSGRFSSSSDQEWQVLSLSPAEALSFGQQKLFEKRRERLQKLVKRIEKLLNTEN